ncbi:MAG: quinone oxidoreductase family protein [Burkholderiaceae bacterium]|jgi:NADPH2:quinone reductase
MTRAVQIQAPGGPEAMKIVDVSLGKPGPGQALVRHHAIGLNYIDVYFRTGTYPAESYPCTLGMEAAGVVEAVGEGVSHVKPGDRVAYSGRPMGAYCDARVMPAGLLIKLPKSISFETGAAMMLKGMTAQYLFRRTANLQKGHTILFHAAAGGVGLIAMQWAKHMGVTVIGTAGSDEKCALAKAHGADHVINYSTEDFVEQVKAITNGRGVDVVYDSVGKSTFEKSLQCLRKYGLMVSFGNASGKVPPLDLAVLQGHLFITRPSLMPYTATRPELEQTAGELVKMVSSGKVKIKIDQTYALADVAQAHRDLEARKTTGSTILLP